MIQKRKRGGADIEQPIKNNAVVNQTNIKTNGDNSFTNNIITYFNQTVKYVRENLIFTLFVLAITITYFYFVFFVPVGGLLDDEAELMCDSFNDCPDGQKSLETTACGDDGCDEETCCIDIATCEDYDCGENTELNAGVECAGEECTVDECCSLNCNTFTDTLSCIEAN